MRILLTGASGYIGLHILGELLSAGHEVTAVVRAPERLGALAQAKELRVAAVDLKEHKDFVALFDGHQAVIHAALIWGDPLTELDLWDTRATAKLFDAAGRVSVERCIYISAVAVHRPFIGEMIEEQALLTTDIYGATKAAGELFLRAACATHGMKGIVLRPGPVVGPPAFTGGAFRTDRRILTMVADARAARPLEVEAGQGRQFTDVTALAIAARLAVTTNNPYTTYICVAREILTWEWIARAVIACVGSPSKVCLQPSSISTSIPRFSTNRVETLLGKTINASKAIEAHLSYLVSLPT